MIIFRDHASKIGAHDSFSLIFYAGKKSKRLSRLFRPIVFLNGRPSTSQLMRYIRHSVLSVHYYTQQCISAYHCVRKYNYWVRITSVCCHTIRAIVIITVVIATSLWAMVSNTLYYYHTYPLYSPFLAIFDHLLESYHSSLYNTSHTVAIRFKYKHANRRSYRLRHRVAT